MSELRVMTKFRVEIESNFIIEAEIEYASVTRDIAYKRICEKNESTSKDPFDKLAKVIGIFACAIGVYFSLQYLVPIGPCKVNYPKGLILLVLFGGLLLAMLNREKLSKKFYGWVVSSVLPSLAERKFRPVRLSVPFTAVYEIDKEIRHFRVSNGNENFVWSADFSEEFYKCKNFILLYKKPAITPNTVIFINNESEVEKILIINGVVERKV